MPPKSKLVAVLDAVQALRATDSYPSKYRLHSAASDTYAVRGMATCSKYPINGESAELVTNGFRAKLRGIVRCKAHQICPICRNIWLIDNRRKIEPILSAWKGAVAAITLTVSHTRSEGFETVINRVRAAKRLFMLSAEYRRVIDLNTIMAVETTIGESGWHPHIHGLLMTGRPLTKTQKADLTAAWRRCVRLVGGRAGRKAAVIEELDDCDIQRAGMYMFKEEVQEEGGACTPFDLLAIISSGHSADTVAAAKELWRDYCVGVRRMKGMRFAAPAGVDVRMAWSAHSRSKKTQTAAETRMVRYSQDIEYLNDGVPATPFQDEILRKIWQTRIPPATQRAVAIVREQLEEAIERRDELGYYDDLDPLGEVDDLLDKLHKILSKVPPAERPAVATIMLAGLRLLNKTGTREELDAVRTADDVERLFAKIATLLKTGSLPGDLYKLGSLS